MLRLKLTLSIVSIALTYYGSQSLYSFFATPAIQADGHKVATASAGFIPGTCALVVGIGLALGCIVWWASSIGRRPRRYSAMYIPPAQTVAATPTGRMLSDMHVPGASTGGRRPPLSPRQGTRGAEGASARLQGGRHAHGIAHDQGRPPIDVAISTSASKVPPIFDPYDKEASG